MFVLRLVNQTITARGSHVRRTRDWRLKRHYIAPGLSVDARHVAPRFGPLLLFCVLCASSLPCELRL